MHNLSPMSRVRLDNVACAYCHTSFGAETPSEDEHVIGRNFVPKGSLAAQWNLIVRSCRACNEEKCELENDLSAITMHPSRLDRSRQDHRLINEAQRKESAQSKRTRKAVGDSAEEFGFQGQLVPGVDITANLISGPQLDPERAYRLAFFHVAAFFYLVTFQRDTRCGKPIPRTFVPIAGVFRQDWGNAQMLGFQEMIANWAWRVHAIGAEGYFKIVIRRATKMNPPLWAWALEWNQTFRVTGFFGDSSAAKEALVRLPVLRKILLERGVDPKMGPFETWGREEVPIAEEDDRLFEPPTTG